MTYNLNLFAVSLEAVQLARSKGIELLPTPNGLVLEGTPPGHYLNVTNTGAQIIAIADYCLTPGVYDDLLVGYRKVEVVEIEVIGERTNDHKFVSIRYEPIA